MKCQIKFVIPIEKSDTSTTLKHIRYVLQMCQKESEFNMTPFKMANYISRNITTLRV